MMIRLVHLLFFATLISLFGPADSRRDTKGKYLRHAKTKRRQVRFLKKKNGNKTKGKKTETQAFEVEEKGKNQVGNFNEGSANEAKQTKVKTHGNNISTSKNNKNKNKNEKKTTSNEIGVDVSVAVGCPDETLSPSEESPWKCTTSSDCTSTGCCSSLGKSGQAGYCVSKTSVALGLQRSADSSMLMAKCLPCT